MKYIKTFKLLEKLQQDVLTASDIEEIKDVFQDIIDEYDILNKRPEDATSMYYIYTKFPRSVINPYELRIDIENTDTLTSEQRIKFYDDMNSFSERLIDMGFKISFFSFYKNVIIVSK